MKGLLIKFKVSFTTLVIGMALSISALFFDFEVFEKIASFLKYLEHYQADEIFFSGILFLIGIAFDLFLFRQKIQHQLDVQTQRLHVMKATLRTVQDIVNNSMNKLLLLKMELEQKNALEGETLTLLDSVIYGTAEKLRGVYFLENTPEKTYGDGITAIDPEAGKEQFQNIEA